MAVHYHEDFHLWTQQQAEFIGNQQWHKLDWLNLREEIDEMGRREKRSIESNLVVLLLHLLKWEHQPTFRPSSWRGSIKEHRRRLRKDLQDSPSLAAYAEEQLAECYDSSRTLASGETGLDEQSFPENCPYKLDQLLQIDFWPQ